MSLETIDLDAPPQPRPATAAVSPLLRRIDLTTLRLFIAVCEEPNLTRAANREGIAGAAEIGICSGEADARGLKTFHYRTDHLVVVVRPDHPLAAGKPIQFADTLDFDHIGLHAASSIYLRSQYAATQADKSMRLRINV